MGDVIDYSDLIDEDPPPSTQRIPGKVPLDIDDTCVALFFSATWVAEARVNGVVVERSAPSSSARSKVELDRWARQMIRRCKGQLWKLGVDVGKAYAARGGDPSDLEDVS